MKPFKWIIGDGSVLKTYKNNFFGLIFLLFYCLKKRKNLLIIRLAFILTAISLVALCRHVNINEKKQFHCIYVFFHHLNIFNTTLKDEWDIINSIIIIYIMNLRMCSVIHWGRIIHSTDLFPLFLLIAGLRLWHCRMSNAECLGQLQRNWE